jgi:hypothetical protein
MQSAPSLFFFSDLQKAGAPQKYRPFALLFQALASDKARRPYIASLGFQPMLNLTGVKAYAPINAKRWNLAPTR